LRDPSPAGPPMAIECITAGVNGGSAITIGNDRPGGEAAALYQNKAA
jgi:hypothetical protein